MSTLVKLIATFLGVGYLPLFPGTWASAVAVGLAWVLPEKFFLGVLLFLAAAGFWACQRATVIFRNPDPSVFVMDEVCGMLLSVLFLPKSLPVYLAAFFLFRLFDIWKPWWIGRLQRVAHPSSIMTDDLLAGVFANLILTLALRAFFPV